VVWRLWRRLSASPRRPPLATPVTQAIRATLASYATPRHAHALPFNSISRLPSQGRASAPSGPLDATTVRIATTPMCYAIMALAAGDSGGRRERRDEPSMARVAGKRPGAGPALRARASRAVAATRGYPRNVYLLLLFTLGKGIQLSIGAVTLTLYAYSIGYKQDFVGLLVAVPSIGSLLAAIPIGFLAD